MACLHSGDSDDALNLDGGELFDSTPLVHKQKLESQFLPPPPSFFGQLLALFHFVNSNLVYLMKTPVGSSVGSIKKQRKTKLFSVDAFFYFGKV